MILETISSSLDVLNKSADFIKKLQEIEMNFTLPNEVKKINAKLDQDITRKIKSGYESIEFALRKSADNNSRDQDLEDARNDLRDCVHLSDELDTNGIPNGDVMAIAHYGLAIVYNLQRKSDRSGYHLLKAFQAGPRKTRELIPQIYDQLFKAECGNLVSPIELSTAMLLADFSFKDLGTKPYNQQASNEDELLRTVTEIGKEVLKGATWIGGGALYLFSGGRIPINILGAGAINVNKEIDGIPPDAIVEARQRQRISQVAENLMKEEEALAKKQDDCCKKTATEYLAKLSFK